MRSLLFSFAVILLICGGAVTHAAAPPNILLCMADDMGFSDLGCYGGEIETPNLDRLAKNGLRFTQFHNTARCWPTRAALLTGYYAQQVRRDAVPGVPSGGRGERPAWAELVPALLKSRGYRSYHSGKWHLDRMPLETGFDRSYYLRDQGRFFNPKVHFEDDKKLPPVEPDSGYYGTTAIADHAVRCLKDHQKQHPGQPFFHYLAFTAPHFPLHALPEDIARYKDRYRVGWDVIRSERWQRMREMNLLSGSLSPVEREIGPPYDFPEALETLGPGEVNRPLSWNDLTPEQQQFQADKMAVHAAMIDRMDREFGRVLDQLKSMHEWENTLILFLSDNGASAEIMVRGDGHDPNAIPGSARTHLCLGPGWSTACNTPFRRHKTWVHEGGTATPLIVHWPSGIERSNEFERTPSHVIDIVPTILELAGKAHPHAGKGTIPNLPGQSLLSSFRGENRIADRTLWWAHEENRAVRSGDWKLVAAKGDPWELYDLSSDPSESDNLAAQHPDKVTELAEQWTSLWEDFQKTARRDLPEQ
ncbi:MAG TPA: arylsulfatase [Planctomycetaceae bacterium]|nr:arylsulfatase [Planctomycetaceae bacterium]